MIKKNFYSAMTIFAVILLFTLDSCSPGNKMEKEEKEQIQDYISSNPDKDFVKTGSGLFYMEVVAGTGTMAVEGDSAYVKYTGRFLSGALLDTNEDTPGLYGFIVGENITGFDEGITMMKEGGKSTLLIPSKLAYGTYGSYPAISGYTPLVFDITLVKVVSQQ